MDKMKVTALAVAVTGSMIGMGSAHAAEYVQASTFGYYTNSNGAATGVLAGGGGGIFEFTRVAYTNPQGLGGTDFSKALLPSTGPTGKFIAFCLETAETLNTPYLWKVDSLNNAPVSGSFGAMGPRSTDLEYLFGKLYPRFGQATIDGQVITPLLGFALQLAVWEIANENGAVGYNLQDGNYKFALDKDNPNGAFEIANGWLGLLNTAKANNYLGWVKAEGLVALIGTGPGKDQDFVGQVVPIPAAAWLLGSGLLGLFGLARRKKTAAAA